MPISCRTEATSSKFFTTCQIINNDYFTHTHPHHQKSGGDSEFKHILYCTKFLFAVYSYSMNIDLRNNSGQSDPHHCINMHIVSEHAPCEDYPLVLQPEQQPEPWGQLTINNYYRINRPIRSLFPIL